MSERASQGDSPGEDSAEREELLDRLANALVAAVCGGVAKVTCQRRFENHRRVLRGDLAQGPESRF